MSVLEVRNLHVHYGKIHAVQGISFMVREGRILSLVGANGAGKSTTMWALVGVVPPSGGEILLDGKPLPTAPHEIVRHGMALVPERRRLFAPLTVYENLQMGSYAQKDPGQTARNLEHVFSLFPVLADRKSQGAGTLSGGEQQMLALGRALMGNPRILLLDEPSLGLAPMLVEQLFAAIAQLAASGVAILLVEQNALQALEISDEGHVLEAGRITLSGPGEKLARHHAIRRAFLGEENDSSDPRI